MRYAILCYNSEAILGSWTKAETMHWWPSRRSLRRSSPPKGKLGPVVRLMPTTTATTVQKGTEPFIIDGKQDRASEIA